MGSCVRYVWLGSANQADDERDVYGTVLCMSRNDIR